jgi:hypothetical protein
MAEAVVPEPSQSQEPAPAPRGEELPRFEQPRAVHGGRFMIGYIVVIIMAGAALAVIAVMNRTDTAPSSTANWGRVAPESDGFQGARELAESIATTYKGANGEQLAAITASPGEIQGLPVRYVAIRAGQQSRLNAGDVEVVDPEETILYTFCGLGGQRNCALPGQPSAERSLLLRREALELSLYTFKHMKDVKSVITLLPPPAQDTNLAVFLQRDRREIAQALDKPLAETLPSAGPHFGDNITTGEAEAINRMTGLWMFRSGFELAPDQSIVLNLEVPTAS